ncbi:MAG: response regulator [Oscillospiraceae bacterium]
MQTILIIDDDAAIGSLEQEVLERAGYAVLRAYSGTEALLLLKDSRPDLVLLDLMLPGLSGEEVLPQLQGISVIVVSAKTAVQDKVGLLLAKSVLLDRIGADTPDCTEGSLKTHISNLRGKLRDATGKDHIEAVWGIGFRLRPES